MKGRNLLLSLSTYYLLNVGVEGYSCLFLSLSNTHTRALGRTPLE